MMKTDEALALVRNPWGRPEAEVREAQFVICDRLEAAEELAVHRSKSIDELLHLKGEVESQLRSHKAALEGLQAERDALAFERDRLEAAERERDEYQRQYLTEQEQRQNMQHEVNRIEAERNALAAHVEAGSRLATIHDYWEWRKQAPETSLARLIVEKQAEALDAMSDEFEVHERARMVLHWRANELRRQAEGQP